MEVKPLHEKIVFIWDIKYLNKVDKTKINFFYH